VAKPAGRHPKLRQRLRERVSRRVQYWIAGHDVIFTNDSRRQVILQGPSWSSFKTVVGPDGETKPVTLGAYSGVHWTVSIMTGSEHHHDWVGFLHGHMENGQWVREPSGVIDRGPVVIGNDAWVGYEALIMSGVTIGDGGVVAARALVRKDVEPYEIVGGNPARHIGYRFEEPIREALLRIKWWSWSEDKVAAHASQIHSNDVEGFVAGHDPDLGAPSCPLCS
jgi:acetyltransferase-like isoleucine patch superfamily enzyme